MIHYSDIRDALAQRHIPELEDAFRAFVGFPNEEGVEGQVMLDDFVQTFADVCGALLADRRIMPSATAEVLAEVAQGHGRIMDDRTYACGARMALDHMPTIRTMIRRHFDDACVDDATNVVALHEPGRA